MDKAKRNGTIAIIMSIVAIVAIIGWVNTANKYKPKELKDVEIIVTNPKTGEKIKENSIIEKNYDGMPKIFNLDVKCGKKILTPSDFEINFNDMEDRFSLMIEIIDNNRGSDYAREFIYEWPIEKGKYDIYIEFEDFDYPNKKYSTASFIYIK